MQQPSFGRSKSIVKKSEIGSNSLHPSMLPTSRSSWNSTVINADCIRQTRSPYLYPNVAYPRRGKTRQNAPNVGARRLGQDEQYLTVREILSEASTLADGALSHERSDFYRFGYTTLGFNPSPPSVSSGQPYGGFLFHPPPPLW